MKVGAHVDKGPPFALTRQSNSISKASIRISGPTYDAQIQQGHLMDMA